MPVPELAGCVRSLAVTVLAPRALGSKGVCVPQANLTTNADTGSLGPVRTRQARKSQREVPRCTRVLEVDALDADARADLGPILYEIFCASYGDLDLETVTDEIVFRPGGRLFVFTDRLGLIVGFVCRAHKIFQEGGKTHAIWTGGAYFRSHVRGGAATLAMVLRQPLAYKLRHPTHQVAIMYEALHPASYRISASLFLRVWPTRHRPTPRSVARLVTGQIGERDLLRGKHPFVVRYPDAASHQRPDARLSKTLQNDPDVAHYLKLNPNYIEGDILYTYVPLTLVNLTTAIVRAIARAR